MTPPPPLPLPPRAGPVVDADGHVVEPRAAWAGLPDQYRPRIVADGRGNEHVVVGDQEIMAVPLDPLARPGGSDPVARLQDMDVEGIDQAVLYPTIGLYVTALTDPSAATAVARAYNDWLASYCEVSPRRLFGAALLPLQDPLAAAAELRRAHGELGFPAAFIRPDPCLGRSVSDRAYDPVWETAEELGLPIGLHNISHSFEPMLACAQLIAYGVLERHPALPCLFLESSGGGAPFWLERLDEQVASLGGSCPDLRLTPSEYFARQCAISFEVDERTLPALAPFIGPERIVWGSDYPHHDSTFPGAVDTLRATIAPCSTAAQAQILGVTARRVYRLPSHLVGPAALIGDYFAAVTTRDVEALAALFAPDAVLESGATRLVGREAVIGYYVDNTFTFDDFRPEPGPLTIEGDRVTVSLNVRLGGEDRSVLDVFETAGPLITALHITGFAEALQAARPT